MSATRTISLRAALLGTVLGTALGASARADEPAPAQTSTVETLVVTATKQATNIQDVPFSISAYSGDSLEKANIKNVTDLTTIVPGLLRPGGTAGGALSIRGAYGRSGFPGVDQDVGMFVDEVAVAGLADMDQEYFDLERIEVLRGPQGTLFGRNVTGGAVSIYTRRPSFTRERRIQLGVGSYGDHRLQALLTGPLSEQLAYKLVASATGHSGYYKNATIGGDVGDMENVSLRGQLLYRPSDRLELLLGADAFHREGEPVSQLIGTAQPGLIWPAVSFDTNDSSQYLGAKHPNGFIRTDTYSFLGRAEWKLDFATLTSISAYRLVRDRNLTAGVGDPLNSDPSRSPSRYHQFTQEIRLASPTDKRFRWVTGLYYLDGYRKFEVRPTPDYRMFGPPYTPATLPAVANLLAPYGYYHPGAFYSQANTSLSAAAFAEVNYDLTRELTLTVGGRYTWEAKKGFSDRSNTIAYLAGPPISAHYDAEWTAFTPKVTLTFTPNDDLMVYATATRGFKSGAFDASTPSTVVGLQTPSNPTYVWNYEAGLKATLFERRLLANLSVFRMDFTDLQVAVFDPIAVSFAFKNAGKARNDGLELELRGKPTSWLSLGTAYTYQDAKYVDYVIANSPPAPPTVNSGNRLIQTPKHALSLFADANWDLGERGKIEVGGSVQYRSKVWLSDTNSDPAYVHDRTKIDGVIDLHASWSTPDDAWEVAVWGRNVTSERYLVYSVDVSSLYRPATQPLPNSIRLANWNAPATWGVTLTSRF